MIKKIKSTLRELDVEFDLHKERESLTLFICKTKVKLKNNSSDFFVFKFAIFADEANAEITFMSSALYNVEEKNRPEVLEIINMENKDLAIGKWILNTDNSLTYTSSFLVDEEVTLDEIFRHSQMLFEAIMAMGIKLFNNSLVGADNEKNIS